MTGDDGAGHGSTPVHGAPVDLGIPSVGPASEIGRGAAGVVYRAEQAAFGRTVAVKLLPFAALDEAARARFERECRAMGTVSGHPGIVTVYEAGFTPSGQPYILMELMDGGSLEQRLSDRGAFRWEEVVEIGVRLAAALETAHRKGILHRDIKPDNVLISTYGDAKLADFSIARLAGATKTQTGLVAATPAHAPPEVLRGEEPSVPADVYSLASTLWALLAGGPAFMRADETTIFPLLRRVEEDPVPDLRPNGVPDAICRVLERAMSKNPLARPATASEFAAELITAREQARAWPQSFAGAGPTTPVPVPRQPQGPGLSSPQFGRPAPPPPTSPPAPALASPRPAGGWPATGAAPPASRGKGLVIGLAVLLAVAVGGVVAAVALTRGGGGTTTTTAQTGSATTTGGATNSSTSTGSVPTGLAGRLLTASEIGSGYTPSDASTAKLSTLKPCKQDIPLGARTDEADSVYMGSELQQVAVIGATFQSGQAAAYLDAVRTAVGCKPYDDTSGPITVTEAVALRSGPTVGDQTVRIEIKGTSSAGAIGEEDILIRKGDTVVYIALVTLGNPDAATADALAQKQAGKL